MTEQERRVQAYKRAQRRAISLWQAYEQGHTPALPYAMRAIRALDRYYLMMVEPRCAGGENEP